MKDTIPIVRGGILLGQSKIKILLHIKPHISGVFCLWVMCTGYGYYYLPYIDGVSCLWDDG